MAVFCASLTARRSSRFIRLRIFVFSFGQVRAADFIAIRCVTRSFRPRCIFFRVFDTHKNHSTRMFTIFLFNQSSPLVLIGDYH